jgi:A/G-specific adenine glycosylase
MRWRLPSRTGAKRVEAIAAAWPSGRWFTLDEALAAGLPAPLRKLLASEAIAAV